MARTPDDRSLPPSPPEAVSTPVLPPAADIRPVAASPRRSSTGRTVAMVVAAAGLLAAGLAIGLAVGHHGAAPPHEPVHVSPPRDPLATQPAPVLSPPARRTDLALSTESWDAPGLPPAPPGTRYGVFPLAGTPWKGAAEPDVVIIEYADFQCPFSARVEATLARILAADSDVRLYFAEYPLAFHTQAKPAAEAALAALDFGGRAQFWKVHDYLFAHQPDFFDPASMAKLAGEGIDLAALRRRATGAALTRIDAAIADDTSQASVWGLDGTPSFLIDGRPLIGAQPIEAFTAIVDEERAAARRDLAAGVPRDRLYATLLAGAASTPAARTLPAPGVPAPGAAPGALYRVEIGRAPMRGPADARVTIVEYADFQCPFCGRLETSLRDLQRRHPRDLRVVWKNYPLAFHLNAWPAAELAVEAEREGKFWPVHDALFADQTHLDRATLLSIAARNGLDGTRAADAIDLHVHRDAIEADVREGSRLGVEGTPTMFINGRLVAGAIPESEIEADVDAARRSADALVAHGTPPSAVYATTIAHGLTHAPPSR